MRGCLLGLLCACAPVCAQSGSAAAEYEKKVQPFLATHCSICHNSKVKVADFNLDGVRAASAALQERDLWDKVLYKLKNGQMPPPGRPKPAVEETQAAMRWMEQQIDRFDRARKPDPGRVTARRLNRAEYNNTIRDLLGVSFRPADDFPVDDSGYGFDNIGDVLTMSPVLMEKYLKAADQVVRAAIVTAPPPKPTIERYEVEKLGESKRVPVDPEGEHVAAAGSLVVRHRFPSDGEYEIRAALRGRGPADVPPVNLVLIAGGKQVQVFPVEFGQGKKRAFDTRVTVRAGDSEIGAAFAMPGPVPPMPGGASAVREDILFVDVIEVRGPFAPAEAAELASDKRIFVCGHAAGEHVDACGRTVVTSFARRAWRRPVTAAEADSLLRFVDMARNDGDTFEQSIQLALKAALVSPHFLFRIERDVRPNDPAALHAVDDFELASRLSYFLWSSMPDDELFRAAERKDLGKPELLRAQVRRMLADPKASALAENFAGQWLELRNLSVATPDPKRFPSFDADLREAMRRETLLFFEAVVKEDRPVLDFIDGRYSFLNERLARHYGIAGVDGRKFRRVELDGSQRSGVITQASILTISSYPIRTSPVLRGLWVLENFLGAPPPPPPPDVPQLDEEKIGTAMSLRQQLEKHRADPGCAVCHTKMDALGFGLENYDPVGAWRTADGAFPIDSAGELPGGRKFDAPQQLKQILLEDKDEFTRCLTEKLLTYALGRGLQSYDKPVVREIARKVSTAEYRFSSMIEAIAESAPFRMRRGDGGKT